MHLEYVNPIAGLAILVIGLFVMIFIDWIYGITPVVVGITLVIYYRKFLIQILGGAY